VSDYELLWVRVQTNCRDVLIGSLYHPPKPKYQPSALLDHIEKCVDLLSVAFPEASVMLGGDFNTLNNDDIVSRCALMSIVDQTSRGSSYLDCKTAVITPVAKVKQPAQPSDFRPISVTPVLSRMLERLIVKLFIYHAIQLQNSELFFDDQYAFRPTGSTTAALVAILHTVNNMLLSNPYVRVFALLESFRYSTAQRAHGEAT